MEPWKRWGFVGVVFCVYNSCFEIRYDNLEYCVDDPKKTQHLLSLDGAKERLHLLKANLLEEGSFDSVVEGCVGVFHTASPFYHAVTNPQETGNLLMEKGNHARAGIYLRGLNFYYTILLSGLAELISQLKGTINVLASWAKTPSIKRVVLTSSLAAVVHNGKRRTPEVVVDESWWSSPELCKEMQTLAEDAAWEFVKEKGIDMVTINPGMVIGPLLQPTLNTSCAAILNLINGGETHPNSTFGWINVKDVANAHILAFENPSAKGRYCLVEKVAHFSEVVKILRELYPSLKLPEKCGDDKPFVPTYQVSKEKAKALGVVFTSLEEGIKETVESLKEKNFFR
ncbi:UNVERIFIED_CONTAM: Cinnamoyl-CoA reductase 1 [Sesamum indicum]